MKRNQVRNVYLENARESAGLTKHQAAELLGLNYNYFVTIESGYNQPSVRLLRAMADLYNTPFLEVLEKVRPDMASQYLHDLPPVAEPEYGTRCIPLIGAAGAVPSGVRPNMAGVEHYKFSDVFLQRDTDYFVVHVADDSLDEDCICQGDIMLFARDTSEIDHEGELVACTHFNDGLFVRRMRKNNMGKIHLTTANLSIPPIAWDKSYQILGAAWGLIRPFRLKVDGQRKARS